MSETPSREPIDLSKCSEQERALAEQVVRLVRGLEGTTSKEIRLTLHWQAPEQRLTVTEAERRSFPVVVVESPLKPDHLVCIGTFSYDSLDRTCTTVSYDFPLARPERGEDDSLPGPDTIVEPPGPEPDAPAS
jgi:hypothetical protein